MNREKELTRVERVYFLLNGTMTSIKYKIDIYKTMFFFLMFVFAGSTSPGVHTLQSIEYRLALVCAYIFTHKVTGGNK